MKGRADASVAAVPVTLEFELIPEDNARLAALCGPLDQNLKLVEQRRIDVMHIAGAPVAQEMVEFRHR